MPPDPPPTLLEGYFESLPADLFREQIADAFEGPVDIRLVLEAAALLHPRVRVREEMRVIGHESYRRLLLRWKVQHPDSSLTLLPALQAYVVLVRPQTEAEPDPGPSPDRNPASTARTWPQWPHLRRRGAKNRAGGVTINLQPLADPGFNWSSGRQLLLQIDAIGEDASLWIHSPEERSPHLERVNGLAFQLLKAIEAESLRRADPRPTDDSSYKSTLEVLKTETAIARQQFLLAAEQSAQRAYAQGMLRRGALVMAVLCSVVGGCFVVFSVPAVTAVALPSGAIGAVISVFQRMHSGKSVADFQTAADRLKVFGALRTLIGGVFGMFVYALIESGLAGPTLAIPAGDKGLAYASVVGFLAGFNERLAQDVITKSSQRVSGVVAARSDVVQGTAARL